MGGDEHQEPGPPATPSAHAVPSWPGLRARAPPPKHTGPFTAWEAWPSGLRPATVSSTALDSAGPPRPRGARPQGPSALALDVRAPPQPQPSPPRALALPLPVSSTPPALGREACVAQAWTALARGLGVSGAGQGAPSSHLYRQGLNHTRRVDWRPLESAAVQTPVCWVCMLADLQPDLTNMEGSCLRGQGGPTGEDPQQRSSLRFTGFRGLPIKPPGPRVSCFSFLSPSLFFGSTFLSSSSWSQVKTESCISQGSEGFWSPWETKGRRQE